MTLPASGPISFNNINVELGVSGTTQASLGQASYRTLAGVPSGQISMSNFYGKANQFAFTISSNQTNLNLASYATSIGWNGSSAVVATIGSGVWIYSTSTGTPALTTGSFPGGLTIVNNGFIAGKGGNGWGYANTGSNGGIAISLGTSVTINNTNGSAYIGGGGGGGGSKYYVEPGIGSFVCGGGGGAGGGNGGTGGGTGTSDKPTYAGGAGSTTPNTAGANGTSPNGADNGLGGGAGGGGGAYNGPGGGGGLIFPGVGGAGGNRGGTAIGGNGGNANAGGGNGDIGGAGGGGGWGASGGVSGTPGGGPGSGGRAVALNGYSVTWVAGNTSRVYGAVS